MNNNESYLLLGLREGASQEEIKVAYRKLAKQYHPDRTQGDEFLTDMFRRIQQAYETLIREGSGDDRGHTNRHTFTDYDELITSYLRQKQRLLSIQEKAERIRRLKEKKYLSFSNVAILLIIVLVNFMLFYPDRLSGNRKHLPSPNATWSLKRTSPLLQSPDVKSPVLLRLRPGASVDSIGSTVYYYKVRYANGVDSTVGYLLKEQIIKRR